METGKSDVLDKIEKINKKDSALQEIIPKGYEIEHHQCGIALNQLIPSKKEGEPDKRFLSQVQSLKSLNALKILRVTKSALICFSMTIKRQ